jgi:hypothetical protein
LQEQLCFVGVQGDEVFGRGQEDVALAELLGPREVVLGCGQVGAAVQSGEVEQYIEVLLAGVAEVSQAEVFSLAEEGVGGDGEGGLAGGGLLGGEFGVVVGGEGVEGDQAGVFPAVVVLDQFGGLLQRQ